MIQLACMVIKVSSRTMVEKLISRKGLLVKIFATKIGMTHLYNDNAKHISATVLEIVKTAVISKKTVEKDGYEALVLGRTGKQSPKKSFIGQLKGASDINKIIEDKGEDKSAFSEKDVIDVNSIKEGDVFEAKSVSKGKGFSGTVKRHGFATGPKTHGSNNYRQPGSIGPTYPQRVIKGRRMAGKMGGEWTTVKNVIVLKVDAEKSRIMVRGPIPGPNKSSIILSK